MEGRILTCVYCGVEYPQDTPASGDKVLTDHIKVCEKHPLRAAEKKIQLLRDALIGFLQGCSTEEELKVMASEITRQAKLRKVPKEDAAIALKAIRVLIATSED